MFAEIAALVIGFIKSQKLNKAKEALSSQARPRAESEAIEAMLHSGLI